MLTHPRQVLYAMGILYDDAVAAEDEPDTVTCEDSARPMFVFRPGRPRRSRKPKLKRLSSFYLPRFDFETDSDIAHALSVSIPHLTIQHRDLATPIIDDIPQSLPTDHAHLMDNTHLISTPGLTSPHNEVTGDWTFIHTAHGPSDSPASEPETWIILSDDS
jgi:hypothetical protein